MNGFRLLKRIKVSTKIKMNSIKSKEENFTSSEQWRPSEIKQMEKSDVEGL